MTILGDLKGQGSLKVGQHSLQQLADKHSGQSWKDATIPLLRKILDYFPPMTGTNSRRKNNMKNIFCKDSMIPDESRIWTLSHSPFQWLHCGLAGRWAGTPCSTKAVGHVDNPGHCWPDMAAGPSGLPGRWTDWHAGECARRKTNILGFTVHLLESTLPQQVALLELCFHKDLVNERIANYSKYYCWHLLVQSRTKVFSQVWAPLWQPESLRVPILRFIRNVFVQEN